jgi:hypothetical protein
VRRHNWRLQGMHKCRVQMLLWHLALCEVHTHDLQWRMCLALHNACVVTGSVGNCQFVSVACHMHMLVARTKLL